MKVSKSVVAGVVAAVLTLIASHLRSTPYNNYVLLAQALLHGHAWIDWPGTYIDALGYNGQHYVIEAPIPAILLLPYVAIAGTAANQTWLAIVLAGIAVGAAWELGTRIGVRESANAWLCAFLLLGTDLMWCAMLGDVWFIAHVSAVCFTLLALVELCGKRRGWLVALWAVCAAESRFTLVLAIPVYVALVLADRAQPDVFRFDKERLRSLTGVGAVFVAAAVCWVWYNLARWGTVTDIGYTTWYHQDQAGMPAGSPFRLRYLAYEIWSFFVQRPEISPVWPWFTPSVSGVALTWTSPALIYALWARRPQAFTVGLWVAAILTAAPNFLYYVNGFAQYGMRHALDFIPFLFALMCLAARNGLPILSKALIAYSCAAGIYGVWFWDALIRKTY